MRIVLYFINWNDSFYLPFLARHYGKFCERIVMYDQHSTDSSQEIAKSLGFEVRLFGDNTINDQTYLDIKNNCWKECRGKGIDYVIVCDADEFINVTGVLTSSCPSMLGMNMISDDLPVNDVFEIKTGSMDMNYAKQAIFSPDRIQEINFAHGCHRNYKIGNITTQDACTLYHYRLIGGVERFINRHKEYEERLSVFNKKHGMGSHYQHPEHAKRAEWDYLQTKAVSLW